jgi:hypothetical protein
VPNIRFKVATTCQQLAALLEPPAINQTIRPALSELRADPDADVRFFSEACAKSLPSGS